MVHQDDAWRASRGGRPRTRYNSRVDQWICEPCGFIYDPEEGDPDGGIPPGTAFEDIPDDWSCPVCGAQKDEFEKLED